VHRFVVAAAGSRGLALLVPGFAQGEWTATGDLFLTVLRAVGELSRDNLPERPGHAGWPTPTPLAQECGPHTVELAVTPINEAAVRHPHQLERLWEEAFLPLQAVFIRDFTGRVADQGGITLKGEGLVATAVKPPEVGAGLVLRCMNTCNAPVTGRWVVTGPRLRASRTRADETDVEPLAVDSGGAVHFTAPPLGVATTRVVPVLG
jgi:alpha-mannosidase